MTRLLLFSVLAVARTIDSILVLPVFDLLNLGAESKTRHAFRGDSLVALSPSGRNEVIKNEVRSRYLVWFGGQTRDPPLHATEYDWLHAGKRVKFKSAMPNWSPDRSRWYCDWGSVKWSTFDRLCLAFHSPGGIHVYHHDKLLGRSSTMLSTDESQVFLEGFKSRRGEVLSHAIITMQQKLTATGKKGYGFRWLAKIPPNFVWAVDSSSRTIFNTDWMNKGTPLSAFSKTERLASIRRVAHQLDMLLHQDATFTNVDEELQGWSRGNSRIKCMTGRLEYSDSQTAWCIAGLEIFTAGSGEQRDFDELLFALYAPDGIHVCRYEPGVGEFTPGKQTDLIGPTAANWETALRAIMGKLAALGCERLAWVQW